MARTILIRGSCTPPDNLAKIGALPETMRKIVPEQEVAATVREFAEACVNTGILACHGRITLSIEVLSNELGKSGG
jgi:hypothetical protein